MNSGTNDVLTIVLFSGFIIAALGMMVLWFAMLIDAFKNPNSQSTMWMVILICFGSLGGIIYYFAIYRKRKKAAFTYSSGNSKIEPEIPKGSYTVNDDSKTD